MTETNDITARLCVCFSGLGPYENMNKLLEEYHHTHPDKINDFLDDHMAWWNLGYPILSHLCKDNYSTEIIAKWCSMNGVKINVLSDCGRSPLSHACVNRRWKTVEFLLNAGADPNLGVESGVCRSPLELCIEHGPVSTVKLMFEKGASVQGRPKVSETPLSLALARFKKIDEGHDAKCASPPDALHVCSKSYLSSYVKARDILKMCQDLCEANRPAKRSAREFEVSNKVFKK